MNLKKSFRLFAQQTIFKVFSLINKYIKKKNKYLYIPLKNFLIIHYLYLNT
ncbi:Uncharacterised protein [Streptococcus pneumoniae]|nr:Uncharacterised protein [Streptococcus pneumoniae]CIO85582.1 Uncharacterised protein [Streptococcus pneumoniae]COK83205.1 Uncharacterised protein [Streptococcus pneumoniae]COP28962.1 Uncharacterised protein [Streptococcus pneumoniae]VFH80514.1 Uncharacterised protein [Streptococcus pneumoniae]